MTEPFSPPPEGPRGPSRARIGIWIAVGGVGAYFLISGIVGILNQGG